MGRKHNVTITSNPRSGELVNEYSSFYNFQSGNELKKLKTTKFNFDLNHPVDIIALPSYDDSVNLILNDGKNPPRLINSRFTVLENNTYEIYDRFGSNDSNLYSEESFDSDVSLQKTIDKIPKLEYLGDFQGGNLPVGNYHFYFKLLDADGNATEIILESGLVSIFLGTTPGSILGGIMNEDSNKLIKFNLSNLDSSYSYVQVFYTRSTSTENMRSSEFAYLITKKYHITNLNTCDIIINGKEPTLDVSIDSLNILYVHFDLVKTLAVCLNRLFFGNIKTNLIDYLDLQDLAYRITLKPKLTPYEPNIDSKYTVGNLDLSYYDSKFIYNTTGYWPNEYYRFGIVFILSDYTISNVFNIAGNVNMNSSVAIPNVFLNIRENTFRKYLKLDEENYKILETDFNNKGVYRFKVRTKDILGLELNIPEEVKKELKDLKIKGYFLVRLKRIPITLCQALTINVDRDSYLPLVNKSVELFLNKKESRPVGSPLDYIIGYPLKKSFLEGVCSVSDSECRAALCPEYDINQEYYNNLFCGDEFIIEEDSMQPTNSEYTYTRHWCNLWGRYELNELRSKTVNSKVIGIPDNAKLLLVDDYKYSARAGEAEEAWLVATVVGGELVRGSFGPYLGIPKVKEIGANRIINIKLKEYDSDFLTRVLDSSEYYAISDRIDIDTTDIPTIYRGDCFICQFTHRMNRNFNSPSTPYHSVPSLVDLFVDEMTWANNYVKDDKGVLDMSKAANINLGDVNAVELGMWVTFTVRSSFNLHIRSTDSRNIEESIKTNHPRGFYPLHPLSASGVYKHPESFVFNKGLLTLVSSKYHYNFPDIPFIKNDFTTRIYYSEIHINDSFLNGFRNFKADNFLDYPRTYGSIVKLVELKGNLLCIFEHGIGLIPVNERSVAGTGSGGDVFINTDNVLPLNPRIISDEYGSKWPFSVVKTPLYVYGVDTVAKKIWKTDGSTIECISDFTVLEFLNKNITLYESDVTPKITERNVKSFYNAFKQDIMFTFYNGNVKWNLCYNEGMNKWITFYSWLPLEFNNIDNTPYSIDLFEQNTKNIWKHGPGALPTNWYGKQEPFEFEFTVVDHPDVHKIFYNMALIANKAKPESFHYEIIGESYDFAKDKLNMYYRQEGLKSLLNLNYDESVFERTYTKNAKSADLVKNYIKYNKPGELEDFYNKLNNVNYNMQGSELVYYPNRLEYRILNHCPAIIHSEEEFMFNSNCHYLEDYWRIHINPIRVNYKNEDWKEKPKIPVAGFEEKIKGEYDKSIITIDENPWICTEELDVKDKFIKIRVRYSGEEIAIINYIKTFYNVSYG